MQKGDLSRQNDVTDVGQHLVEGGEDGIKIFLEAVLVLASCGSREQKSRSNYKFEDVFQRLEAFLDGFLLVSCGHVLSTVLNTRLQAPAKKIKKIINLKNRSLVFLILSLC